jgi:hypothetical protein
MNVEKLFFVTKFEKNSWQQKWIAECARKASKDWLFKDMAPNQIIMNPETLKAYKKLLSPDPEALKLIQASRDAAKKRNGSL